MLLPPPDILQMQKQNNVSGLIEALQYPDANIRRHAVASLRLLGAWYAVPALENALVAENDWQTHRAIVATIEYLDHDVHLENIVKSKDVRGLAKMLNSPREDDVLIACRSLGDLGDPLAVEPLIVLFRNPMAMPKTRLAAAEALLKLKSAPALVSLLGALRNADWQARRNAASVLGQIRAMWAVEPLIVALSDSAPVVRRAAAGALKRINTTDALAAVQLFETSEPPSATQSPGLSPIPPTDNGTSSSTMSVLKPPVTGPHQPSSGQPSDPPSLPSSP